MISQILNFITGNGASVSTRVESALDKKKEHLIFLSKLIKKEDDYLMFFYMPEDSGMTTYQL